LFEQVNGEAVRAQVQSQSVHLLANPESRESAGAALLAAQMLSSVYERQQEALVAHVRASVGLPFRVCLCLIPT
jgi:hypothetical protein